MKTTEREPPLMGAQSRPERTAGPATPIAEDDALRRAAEYRMQVEQRMRRRFERSQPARPGGSGGEPAS